MSIDPRGHPADFGGQLSQRGNLNMQLAGKVVLVTGAQQGIGRAMALEFAAAGADVAINWLDDNAAAQRVADEVGGCGRRAILVQADVARVEQVQAMVSSVRRGSARSTS
jgi:NAD(P)-dependent dehydrogenase (short-subunit alcohol dehydrogenase family)